MPLEDQSKIVPLSPADFAAAQADLTDLTTKLMPLLRHFTPEYIKRLTKYGEKSDAFIQQADAALTAIPGVMPGAFNAQDFHDYVVVMDQLDALLGPLATLFDGLTDAKMLVGSFLMQNGNFIFGQLKSVENLDPRAVPYVENMKKRYEHQGTRNDLKPKTS